MEICYSDLVRIERIFAKLQLLKGGPMNSKCSKLTLPGISIISEHIEVMLESSSASIYWKNKKGEYLGINPVFSQISGMNESHIIGYTDKDLLWSNEADIMRMNDQEVIHTALAQSYFEKAKNLNGGMDCFKSQKYPLRSKSGKIIGLFGVSLLCNEQVLFEQIQNKHAFLDTVMNSNQREFSKRLPALSHRQAESLYYLLHGMTNKEIAKCMKLSPRTVEHYVDTIKMKLHCEKRSELVLKAMELFSLQ